MNLVGSCGKERLRIQNTKGGLRFAIADYASGLKSFPDRSKLCAIVYIGVTVLNIEDRSLISGVWIKIWVAIATLMMNPVRRICLFYEQG
jgi:hypothetical protein